MCYSLYIYKILAAYEVASIAIQFEYQVPKNKKIDVLVICFGFYSIVDDFKQLKKRGGYNVLLSM